MALPDPLILGLGTILMPLIQQVVGKLLNDDPSNPTIDPQQGSQMIVSQIMPLILMMMMQKDGGDEKLDPMMLMLLMGGGLNIGGVASNPTQDLTALIASIKAQQAKIDELYKLIDELSKKK